MYSFVKCKIGRLMLVLLAVLLVCSMAYAKAAGTLKIIEHPEDQYGINGVKVVVKVVAEGKGLSYRWMMKDPGDTEYTESSVQTAAYGVTMDSTRDGRKLYCIVTDENGNSVQSREATLHLIQPPTIITQPQNVTVAAGQKAQVSVKAVGEGLNYKWMMWEKGDEEYHESSISSATYTTEMNEKRDGRRLFCIITDKYGQSVQSDTVVIEMAPVPQISRQPQSVLVAAGEDAVVTIEAEGDGLQYQWMFRDTGSKKFSQSSVIQNTYVTEMNAERDNRELYCIVTDAYGQSVQSDTVTLRMAPPIRILKQPENTTVVKGEKANVQISAEGEGLTYKWMIQEAGDTRWNESSVHADYYSVQMDESRDGRKVYCVIADIYGQSAESEVAVLNMAPVPKIIRHPENQIVRKGENISFSVEAEGEGLTYQWMICNADSSEFKASSIQSAVYETTMDEAHDGRKLYCVVTDVYGQSVGSNVAVMSMIPEAKPLQPDQIAVGTEVFFGSYEQDNDTANGPEDIAWTVLEKKNNYVLLLSRDVLDCVKYNEQHTDITWSDASLRQLLNGSFYDQAFSDDEKKAIQIVINENPDASDNSGGPHTADMVFILNQNEFNKYAGELILTPRVGRPTQYALARGVEGDPCCWWLRSPGSSQDSAATVDEQGIVYQTRSVVGNNVGVRPVVMVDISSKQLFESAQIKTSAVQAAAPTAAPAAAPVQTPVATAVVYAEPGQEEILVPAMNETVRAGEALKAEWTPMKAINCCTLQLYSLSSGGSFVWESEECFDGEFSTVIPAEVLLPGEYVLRLMAWGVYDTGEPVEEFNLEVRFTAEAANG